jgi:hypothetical protein
LFVCTRHEEECSLLILVDAMHFLKHCPLVSVADKRYIYLFPFQFITWTACFPGSDMGRIKMRFLSTVPWCLLQLSNHSPFIKNMMFYYLSRLLCWIRHGENQNTILCLVYEHMSPFCIVVTADIIMNVYLLLPLEGP